MMKTAATLSEWFEQFGLPVYLEDDVPDDAVHPYITIPLKDPDWRVKTSFLVKIWYRTTTNIPAIQKADEIKGTVYEGARLYFDGGLLVIRADDDMPIQLMTEGDYRCALVPLTLNAYHLPGV